jgi:hypothetical protein
MAGELLLSVDCSLPFLTSWLKVGIVFLLSQIICGFSRKTPEKSAAGRNAPTRFGSLAYFTKIVKKFLHIKFEHFKTAGF